MALGVGVVVVSALIAKVYLDSRATGRRKKKGPITLEDPAKKYSLKLIDKKLISHDTRRYSSGRGRCI